MASLRNLGITDSYKNDVINQLSDWRFSRVIQEDEFDILLRVYREREGFAVAAATIARARIATFNARGKR